MDILLRTKDEAEMITFWLLKKQHYIDLQIVYYARTMCDKDTMTKRNSFTRETGDRRRGCGASKNSAFPKTRIL